MENTTNELDTRGLNCPLPVLKTRKALNDLAPGELLKVTSTDPGSIKDFPTFAKQTGHELVSQEELDGEFVFILRKSEVVINEEE